VEVKVEQEDESVGGGERRRWDGGKYGDAVEEEEKGRR